MNKLITLIKVFTVLFLLGAINENQDIYSQSIIETSLDKNNAKRSTLYELQEKFNEKWDSKNVDNGYYFNNGIKTKAAGWKIFKREEWFWEQRVDINTGEFPQTNAAIEYEKVKNTLNKSDAFSESWTNLGTNSSDGGYAGIGRINCVAFHPSDANTFWVGSPSGGIWRTTDGGGTWTILNSSMTTLGVSDIAIPSDFNGTTSNTIYITTGDRDGGSLWSLSGGQGADNASVGVYKSTNGGASWTATGLTLNKSAGDKIYRLLIHPTNSLILLASTSDGIFKTSDGGATWSLTSISSSRFRDMEFKPGDPSIIYAGRVPVSDTYVYKSTNTGDTWVAKSVSGVVAHYGSQIEVAVSANDPAVVYVLLQDGRIYKSIDSGETYAKISTNDSQNMMGYYSDGAGSESQASYDLCMAVSPTNDDIVLIGGVNTWKSTDGGVTWTINNMWTSSTFYNKGTPLAPEVHADKHILAYQASGIVFEGNDGGIYKSTNDGTSWTDLSNGLVISQLYRIGVSQTSSSTIMTGLQDNGSKLYNGTWSDVIGGDGMECIVDYSNAQYMYGTYVRGKIYRSTNTGSSFPTVISANIPGGQQIGAWVTPYLIDPNSSTTLFAGYDRVWKTSNRGDGWTSASDVLSSTDKLRSLAIAPSNSLVLYTADKSNMWKTVDGGATSAWTPITLPSLSNSITYIAVHETDPNTVWFTVGGYTSGQKFMNQQMGELIGLTLVQDYQIYL